VVTQNSEQHSRGSIACRVGTVFCLTGLCCVIVPWWYQGCPCSVCGCAVDSWKEHKFSVASVLGFLPSQPHEMKREMPPHHPLRFDSQDSSHLTPAPARHSTIHTLLHSGSAGMDKDTSSIFRQTHVELRAWASKLSERSGRFCSRTSSCWMSQKTGEPTYPSAAARV
jgi:hypothetical protein